MEACIRCLVVLALTVCAPLSIATEHWLAKSIRHVRNVGVREWSHFPEKPDSPVFTESFDLAQPESWVLLTLRQADVKQAWAVTLNGRKLGQLERDHNDLELALEVPPGLLKPTGNKLEIRTASTEPDDIRLGQIALQQRSHGEFTRDATVSVTVTDAKTETPLPCRLTITNAATQTLALLGADSDDRLAVRTGVVYTLDGRAQFGLRAGRYRIWAGRGFEYSLAETEIEVRPGEEPNVSITLRREVPTPGLVACDTHLHTNEFARHGDATLVERLISLAGEAVELPISTEHDQHIDYEPEARRIGASKYFTPMIGCEVTTKQGHFNSFPIESGAEPAQHRLRPWPQVFRNIHGTPGVKVVILNHGRDVHSGFRPFGPKNFDPKSGRFLDGRKLEANALELINSGAQQTDPMQLVRDWFSLLKSGHSIAGVGSSDSHTVNFAIAGQARTYVVCPDRDPGSLDVAKAIESFISGATHVSFGLLTTLEKDTRSGRVTAKVLGPSWTRATTLTLFANGQPVEELTIPTDEGKRAGLKFVHSWKLHGLELDASRNFLVAVAKGPGITSPWWPMMPPYQPDSPDFNPYVMGISPALWLQDHR